MDGHNGRRFGFNIIYLYICEVKYSYKWWKNYFYIKNRNKGIREICKDHNIENYFINTDGSIDVNGNVNFSYKNLSKFPLKFDRVLGYFTCNDNFLTTLEGGPTYVGRYFFCQGNGLTTLEFAPTYVGESFVCYNNNISSLKFATKNVGKMFSTDNRSEFIFASREGKQNPLPEEIWKYSIYNFENMEIIKSIIQKQDDYQIWNPDGSFNKGRFEMLMEEIEDERSFIK